MENEQTILTNTEEQGRLVKPTTRKSLQAWVNMCCLLAMPDKPVCPGHATPLDYLAHAFFEKDEDAVVWACRGGGKTMLGAVATLLDMVFKPGVQVRILGGSLEQSEKMYRYLRQLVEQRFLDLVKGEPTRQRLELTNGSAVEILTQSERAVRGMRVQKLRCDEVELFDPAVWQAAQLTTKSMQDGIGKKAPWVLGRIEALSTMHRPGGIMQKIIMGGEERAAGGRKHFTWCVWDVISKCAPERSCDGCVLWEECRGRAKHAQGFVPVDDVIAMKARVSKATWEHEMLCHPPRLEDAVFYAFTRATHVREYALHGVQPHAGEMAMVDGRVLTVESVVAGVDFGYHVFVCLWVVMLRGEQGERVVWVVDELVRRQRTLGRNVEEMKSRGIPIAGLPGAMTEDAKAVTITGPERWRPAVVYCDVAGTGVNSQTGLEDDRVLRGAGFGVKSSGMRIEEGLAVMNELVDPAIEGGALPRLLIDPRCAELIAAMEGYRRKEDGRPEKDGQHDHLIDALRYALVNHGRRSGKVEMRPY